MRDGVIELLLWGRGVSVSTSRLGRKVHRRRVIRKKADLAGTSYDQKSVIRDLEGTKIGRANKVLYDQTLKGEGRGRTGTDPDLALKHVGKKGQ